MTAPVSLFRASQNFAAVLALTVSVGAAWSPPPAAAQTCDRSGCGFITCGTPVAASPQPLWGELQPATTGALPLNRDSSAFMEFTQAYASFPWFTGLDMQNGILVAGEAWGLSFWDLRTHPASPDQLGKFSLSSFPQQINNPEEKWPLQDVAMVSGVDTIAATVGHAGLGIAFVDFTDRTHARLLYQNEKKDGEQVYVTTIGGNWYAFMAASGGSPSGGVFAYDMTRGSQFSNCLEGAPADPVNCSGVYLGKIGSRVSASYLHGVDNFIVFSSGAGSGFEIWNVADPRQPQRVLTALNDPPTCGFDRWNTHGVAMWKDANSHYYVGLRTERYSCAQQRTINDARIYDVSCVTSSCASGLGSPIFTKELDTGTVAYYVTFSRSFGVPFLYYGSDDRCRGGSQREWLFDVGNPAAARDITPPTGYWGWYYRGGATGFNNVMPRRAKFNNEYLYRAGLAIFDVHRHTSGVPAQAAFTWSPLEIYPGTPVNFLDTSTAFPTNWTWTFADPAASAVPPPQPQPQP